MLNVWQLLRYEVTLTHYSFEAVIYHVLHKRIPYFSQQQLHQWFMSNGFLHRWRTVRFYFERVSGCLDLLDELNFIGKTSEFARLYGILFHEVISRGRFVLEQSHCMVEV